MKQTGRNRRLKWPRVKRWAASLILFIAMMCDLLPVVPATAEAATMEDYLNTAVEWGVMRGDLDGNLNPNGYITRAEFVAMVNRAYGYSQMGETNFEDIKSSDWFYEDICIAYNTGYFLGESDTKANPYGQLTREQAAVLVGRNMMLEEGTGEALGFTDSRDFKEWSRHLIQAVAEKGVVTGNDDGSFAPQKSITRGQVAAMLVRAIGTPIQKPGEHSLGGVYGNVTITSPGVTLKDTTIAGDLYITGGLGLGDIDLENVTVLGRIVVSGAGESEQGEHSVTLRNVAAEELLLDSMANQFVTLKAEGLTDIGEVNVRTSSYLEDLTEDGLGLQAITLDGESGTNFYLAGNIKDVVNLTDDSTLNIAQGVAKTVTVDEAAIGSSLNIATNAVVSKLNLDAAANVIGAGDVSHLNVNAAGSAVTMLPDTVTVRPGITANISGENMDTVTAEESSSDPRILSGYPFARNVAPTSAEIVFKTNKKGTIYWALTAMADGSAKEEELISPPAYGSTIIRSGVINAAASNTEYIANLTGLTADGSYYVSAILVDNRDMRSPVKVTAFTTPDDTVPAFTSGYPYAIIADGKDGEQIIQVMAMTNKDCLMYYALMPKGAAAPTAADFKANSLSGNLGHGVVEMDKNTPQLVPKVNSAYLQEETEYELYLWLTDADGSKSSAVTRLTVTTLDRTPPMVTSMLLTDVRANGVTLTYTLNEPGTLYWAVVKDGATFYTKGNEDKDSESAKIQIESGINALRNGASGASRADTQVTLPINGLEPQTTYDVYYVAKDQAGNYGVYTATIDMPFEVHTLDSEAPTVEQEFTHDGSEGGSLTPYPDTSIRLVFSESVQGLLDLNGDSVEDGTIFLELYNDYRTGEITAEEYAGQLRNYIKLYKKGELTPVNERNDSNDGVSEDGSEVAIEDWVIDYRNVTIAMDSSGTGELVMTFPYSENPNRSALNLSGGVTYYFTLEGIADTSAAANKMVGVRGVTTLPSFTTISAQIQLAETYEDVPEEHDGDHATGNPAVEGEKWNFDFVFSATPRSHDAMADTALWDLTVWSEVSIQFKVYESLNDGDTWQQVGQNSALINTSGAWLGASMGAQLRGGGFQKLNELDNRIFAIEITSIEGETKRENWNMPITLQITAVSGDQGALTEMSNMLQNSRSYADAVENNDRVTDITAPLPLPFTLTRTFMDDTPPNFDATFPKLTAGDSSVTMEVSLDRSGAYFYYVVAPLGSIVTTTYTGRTVVADSAYQDPATEIPWSDLPKSGSDTVGTVYLNTPTSDTIMNLRATTSVKVGNGTYNGVVEEVSVTGLRPKTQYIAYFVLRGESQSSYSPKAYAFRFETGDVATPTIELEDASPSVGVTTSTDADLNWILVASPTLTGMRTFTDLFYDSIGLNSFNMNDLDIDTVAGNGDGVVTADEVKEHFERHWSNYFNANDLENSYTGNDTTTGPVKNHLDVRVIDALMANMGTNDQRSVFDYYAGTGVYNQVLNAITQSTGTSYRADSGDMDTLEDQYYSVTSNKMSPMTQYYFIAAARNTMGTIYGFKAIDSIHVVDNTPPNVASHTTSARPYDKDDKELSPSDTGTTYIHHYNGTLTIVFTKTPYRTYYTADNKVITEPLDADTIANYIIPGDLTIPENGITVSGQTIQIKYEGARENSTLTLFGGGYISDNLGNTLNKTLVFRFKGSPMFINGGYTADFTYSWN